MALPAAIGVLELGAAAYIAPNTILAIEGIAAELAGVSGVSAGTFSLLGATGEQWLFSLTKGATRASADQIRAFMQCSTFREALRKGGYSWAPSPTTPGAGTMTKGQFTYHFYPASKSGGEPSALLKADDYRVAKFRFDSEAE